MNSAVIVIGGDPPPAGICRVLPIEAIVIAADSGYDHARRLGLRVDLLVGDLDSISPAGLAEAEYEAIPIDRHPPAKDATDTELAIERALEAGATHLVLVAGGGDRLDHLLGALFALAAVAGRAERVTMWWGTTAIEVLHGDDSLHPLLGGDGVFSLLPVHGGATGVSIAGARYPLHDAELPAGVSLGVSNLAESADAPVTVRLQHGTVLVISPDALEPIR